MAYTMSQRDLNVVVPLWHHRPQIIISSDALKHIIGMSEKRSTPAPETVTVRKNNVVSPPCLAPGPLQIFCRSNLPWQYLHFILSTTSVSI